MSAGHDGPVERGTQGLQVLYLGDTDERVAWFVVEDDGPGIPEAKRDEVFAYGSTTESDGTGFGLAIVADVVTAHGWDITVTDGSDGGARFEVTDLDE